jgi:hypothetical protein
MVPIKWNLPCFHLFFVNDGNYISELMSAFSWSILPAMLSGPTAFFGVDVVDEFQYAFIGN